MLLLLLLHYTSALDHHDETACAHGAGGGGGGSLPTVVHHPRPTAQAWLMLAADINRVMAAIMTAAWHLSAVGLTMASAACSVKPKRSTAAGRSLMAAHLFIEKSWQTPEHRCDGPASNTPDPTLLLLLRYVLIKVKLWIGDRGTMLTWNDKPQHSSCDTQRANPAPQHSH